MAFFCRGTRFFLPADSSIRRKVAEHIETRQEGLVRRARANSKALKALAPEAVRGFGCLMVSAKLWVQIVRLGFLLQTMSAMELT